MSQPDDATPPNLAPWGTKRRMRILCIVGLPGSILTFLLCLLAPGRTTHAVVITGIIAAFWIVAVPLARRRGKI